MRILWIVLLALLISCNSSPPAQAEGTETPDTSADEPADNTEPEPEPEPEPVFTSYFSGNRAWDYLVHQVEMGFRVPGSVTHLECRRWLQKELEKYCDEVELQQFTRQLPPDLENVKMWNVIGRIDPEAERRILLVAHWDTRPTADYNPAGECDQPIAGANDGASGVAVLLELARVFSEVPPPVGIDILLTDGEDYGPGLSTMFMGAEHFANQLTINDVSKYNYGILLDMIGDKNLDIHPEYYSEADAGMIYAVAIQYAEAMGYMCFKAGGGYRIMDDHLAISERGIRIYDFIDFNYEYWHTTEDTADKCSADSLEAVGRVVENMIYLAPEIYGADDQKSRPRYAR